MAYVASPHTHAAGVDVVEASNQARDSGLAATRGAHDRRHGARRNLEGNAAQDGVVGLVGEGHVSKSHAGVRQGRVLIGAGRVLIGAGWVLIGAGRIMIGTGRVFIWAGWKDRQFGGAKDLVA